MNAPAQISDAVLAAGDAINEAKRAIGRAAVACYSAGLASTGHSLLGLSREASALLPRTWVDKYDAELLARIRSGAA